MGAHIFWRYYAKIPLREQVEVLVLSGDVSDEASGESELHARAWCWGNGTAARTAGI